MMPHHGIISKKMYSQYYLLAIFFLPAVQFYKATVMFMSPTKFSKISPNT